MAAGRAHAFQRRYTALDSVADKNVIGLWPSISTVPAGDDRADSRSCSPRRPWRSGAQERMEKSAATNDKGQQR